MYFDILVPIDTSFEEARYFYEKLLQSKATQDIDGSWVFDKDDFRLTQEIVQKATTYRKGIDIRKEFHVEDAREWEKRFMPIGCEVTRRTSLLGDINDLPNEHINYIEFKDPYGHIWTVRES